MYKWTCTVQNHVFSRVNCVYHVLALIIPEHNMHKNILLYVELCLKQFLKNKAKAVEILATVSYSACLSLQLNVSFLATGLHIYSSDQKLYSECIIFNFLLMLLVYTYIDVPNK